MGDSPPDNGPTVWPTVAIHLLSDPVASFMTDWRPHSKDRSERYRRVPLLTSTPMADSAERLERVAAGSLEAPKTGEVQVIVERFVSAVRASHFLPVVVLPGQCSLALATGAVELESGV